MEGNTFINIGQVLEGIVRDLERAETPPGRDSGGPEITLALRKVQEAAYWLGVAMGRMNAPQPEPTLAEPESSVGKAVLAGALASDDMVKLTARQLLVDARAEAIWRQARDEDEKKFGTAGLRGWSESWAEVCEWAKRQYRHEAVEELNAEERQRQRAESNRD